MTLDTYDFEIIQGNLEIKAGIGIAGPVVNHDVHVTVDGTARALTRCPN